MQFIKDGPDIPERLLQAHEDGRVVFFCGAGVSYPAGLPGFGTLVDKIYTGLGELPNAIEQAAIKARQFDTAIGQLEGRIHSGRLIVREQLAKVLTPRSVTPKTLGTHDALLTLAQQHEGPFRLITTNFDRLFEEAIRAKELSVDMFCAPLLPVPKNRWDGLIYLHGLLPAAPTAKDLDRLVISSGDFGLAYLAERWAARFISELFRNYTICFVGYSLDDSVLRYMMDALAADRLLGEFPPEMFAFGSYSKGKEEIRANEWLAKNVTPILYREHNHHSHLHKTLRSWAQTYRGRALGKERIVFQYAAIEPMESTVEDDFIGRMLWALSDKHALPARRFADHDPLPSLKWLEFMSQPRLKQSDLNRFGVAPMADKVDEIAFSLVRRPAPYSLAPWMTLVGGEYPNSKWDDVMHEIARWLARHIHDPRLLLWVVKQGGRLHHQFSSLLNQALDKDPPPPQMMQKLWGVVLSGRARSRQDRFDLYEWSARLKRNGLTPTLRLELRDIFSPHVQIREPFRYPEAAEADEKKEPSRIKNIVNWEIILGANHVHSALEDLATEPNWKAALPDLLTDASGLLRDTLDLMRELGDVDDSHDGPHMHQPSISNHPQNNDFREWTALINLVRDAWLATAELSPERARLAAAQWLTIPYPLFRRLAFFAASDIDIVAPEQGLDYLLADAGRWLWSPETQREALRLLVAITPKLDAQGLATLEHAILQGLPRLIYEDIIEPEQLQQIADQNIWLRLAKASATGVQLGPDAQSRLQDLEQQYPDLKLASDERDEFPFWTSNGDEWRKFVATPKRRRELVEWLREATPPDHWQEDDWLQRCSEDFPTAACALISLSSTDEWPVSRWRQALQAWADEKLLKRSWRYMGSVIQKIPDEILLELAHPLSWWLQSIAKTFEGQEAVFLDLLQRMMTLEHTDEESSDSDPVFLAINHPVGQATEAALRWWFRQLPGDKEGLPGALEPLFTQLCDTRIGIFRHGRVVLAAHVITLYRVDPNWATQHLLPLFEWKPQNHEAASIWEGFLWSPRLYRPLIEAIKQPFLATAEHYTQLGEHRQQYAALLTFAALETDSPFSKADLGAATRSLPAEGLQIATNTLVRALEGAGTQRSEYWSNRVKPYLKSIWPKSRDIITTPISKNFARLCVAALDAFPDALSSVKHWLQPLDHPDDVVTILNKATILEKFPAQALEFLGIVIDKNSRRRPRDLDALLEKIRTAEPALVSDNIFKRLVAK